MTSLSLPTSILPSGQLRKPSPNVPSTSTSHVPNPLLTMGEVPVTSDCMSQSDQKKYIEDEYFVHASDIKDAATDVNTPSHHGNDRTGPKKKKVKETWHERVKQPQGATSRKRKALSKAKIDRRKRDPRFKRELSKSDELSGKVNSNSEDYEIRTA